MEVVLPGRIAPAAMTVRVVSRAQTVSASTTATTARGASRAPTASAHSPVAEFGVEDVSCAPSHVRGGTGGGRGPGRTSA